MKISHTENETKKLYIQKEDLLIIKEEYETVPDFIENSVKENINDSDFIEINNEGQIGYINLIKWIIDFDKYKNITTDEYNKLYQDYLKKLSRIDQEISLGINTNDNIVMKHIITKEIKDIYAIYQNKYTDNKIILPIKASQKKIKR